MGVYRKQSKIFKCAKFIIEVLVYKKYWDIVFLFLAHISQFALETFIFVVQYVLVLFVPCVLDTCLCRGTGRCGACMCLLSSL